MPFESFNEPVNRTIPEQADNAAKTTGSAQHALFGSILFSDTASTAVALGTTNVALGLADDVLTRSILTKLPSEQTPLQQWWVKNSDASHRELFAKHTNELAPLIKELHVADAKIQSGKAGMLETAAVLEQIRAPLTEALGTTQAAHSARSNLYKAEAESINQVLNANKHAAFYEVEAALSRDTVATLHPKAVSALLQYKDSLQGGDPYGTAQAKRTLGSIADSMQDTVRRYQNYQKTVEEGSTHPVPPRVHRILERIDRIAQELGSQILRKQETLLKNIGTDFAAIDNAIGSAEEVASGEKLFINNSRSAIAVKDYGYYSSKVEVQTNKMHQAQLNINARLNPASLPEFGAPGANLYKAMGWCGLSTGAGYAVDSLFTAATGIEMVDRHGNHGARLAIDGALVPSIIMAELPMRYKAPLAVAAFASGRATTYFQANESVSPQLSDLLQPTTSDTVLLGGAIMSPLSAKYKAVAIGASIAIGRGINYAYQPETLNGRK